MKALVADHAVTVIPASDEVKRLSDVYISACVIPDETKGMTTAEHTAYFHEAAARLLAPDTSSSRAMASNDLQFRIPRVT
jgi:hypothetical protein